MTALASTVINTSALWKILLAALIGGGGVVIAMGLALVSLEHASAIDSRAVRMAYRGLAGICGVCCIGVVAVGIYAMTQKPSAKPPSKAKTPSAEGTIAAQHPRT
jgi:hypothetical protein